MAYECSRCHHLYESAIVTFRCDCGGPLAWIPPAFNPDSIEVDEPGFWRYAPFIPPVPHASRVTLGETRSPLVAVSYQGIPVLFKVDYQFPSGSFKDRGSALLISTLKDSQVQAIHDDSSGNAGASLAAYCAAAEMHCRIYIPASNSRAKLRQIEAYGAELVEVEGDRSGASAAAYEDRSVDYYASHNWNPIFAAGIATLGYELWEQMHGKALDAVIAPAGYGSVILGLDSAFTNLKRSGLIADLPRLFAVQTDRYPGIARAWEGGTETPQATGDGYTIAEGIACRLPVRGREVLTALRSSRGAAITVSDTDIQEAWRRLARTGFYVEPTSAVAVAGLQQLFRGGALTVNDRVAVVLTGSGLKVGSPGV